MIIEDRLTSYINSLDMGNTPFLDELEAFALETEVPIIRKDMQTFLKMFLAMKKPENILEIGTAIGFSALLMAEYNPGECHITTIENYDKRIVLAKENIKKAGKEDVITLMEGDALGILPTLTGKYDFIFSDAAKGQYVNYLPDIKRMLKKGGVLISDNILQDGDLIESRFAVVRRNRTIHKRMREYVYMLTHDEELRTSLLPVGDGITVSVKL
ncbi:MAG: O-methyltransferase [Lachnospiraceae bacterium]|nr:O-methyltransferase [Lachnospiraceae bacterium]